MGKRELMYVEICVWLIPSSKGFEKMGTNLSVLLNKMDSELSDYESLHKVTHC